MIASEDYRNIVYFKLAAMGQVALVPTQTRGSILNPMPDVPVTLFFLFIIGFLIFLLRRSYTLSRI